jgi:hypothetical protein
MPEQATPPSGAARVIAPEVSVTLYSQGSGSSAGTSSTCTTVRMPRQKPRESASRDPRLIPPFPTFPALQTDAESMSEASDQREFCGVALQA